MDKELFKNASGYSDPTAYNAMKGMINMNVNAFEIYTYDIQGNEKMGIVLAQESGFTTILPLLEKQRVSSITVPTVRGERFVSPACMSYVTDTRLIDYVQTVPESIAEEIRERISALFMDVLSESDNEGHMREFHEEENAHQDDKTELLAAEIREKEIYKGLYRELLDKLVQR